MGRRALARAGACHLRARVLARAEREGRSPLGLAGASTERRAQPSARAPTASGDPAAPREGGLLAERVHPVLAWASCGHQGDPRARPIPHGAHLGRGHNAGPAASRGHERRAPGRLPCGRLVARAATPRRRVTQADCDRTSEPGLDGLPGDPGAGHRDHRTGRCDAPGGAGQERRRGGRTLPPCLAHLPVGIDAAPTRGARVRVDVETTTHGRFHLPGSPLLRGGSPPRARDRGAPATRVLVLRVSAHLDWWGCRTPDRPLE